MHRLSVSSGPVIASGTGNLKAHGTGFLYLHKNVHYYVTAWHVLSGRHFISKQPISPVGWLPQTIQTAVQLELDEGSGTVSIGPLEFTARIYSKGNPIWLVDGQRGSALDVAVIPLRDFVGQVDDPTDAAQLKEVVDKLDGSTTYSPLSFTSLPARLLSHRNPNFSNELTVAQDVFLIGYPEAIGSPGHPAIWKRGTIASEPSFPLNGRPCFLIDSATRPGLSGSPVVARYENPSRQLPRGVLTKQGSELGFCGVYTARIGGTPEQAQLGAVWPADVIEGIIEKGVLGTNDFAKLSAEGMGQSIV